GTAVQTLPVGDAVSATMLLQKHARSQGWAITASVATLRGITGAVKIGARALIELPGRSAPMDAAEVVSLAL
ncbi:MAG: adenylate/guanylate cyclase domain-containing response regulator, partial [Burkholderiaceae bacterium]|nr:adenylate/guanylate cyclase domain-containing response regulator [Burkholderiaceae bacterium]